MLATTGDVLGGMIGGTTAGLVAAAGWLGKRRIDRRKYVRLLGAELLKNWDALDAAAAFGGGLPPAERLDTSYYRAQREQLADLLSDEGWERVENAYDSIASAIASGQDVTIDLQLMRIHTEAARDACAEALRACGSPPPATWPDRMRQTEEDLDRSRLEFNESERNLEKVFASAKEALSAREAKLSPGLKRFRDLIDEALADGKSVSDISNDIRNTLGTKVSEKDLAQIDEVILLQANVVRLKRERPDSSQGISSDGVHDRPPESE